MTARVALAFEDGVTRFIDCAGGETVADAAYRQGVNIPLDCRDGACGTCKSVCESGSFDLGFYIEDALTEDEAAEGYVLTCQMRPKSDCVVRIAASSAACKVKAAEFAATLEKVERLSDTAIGFSVRMANGGPAFLPGQYVAVGIPGTSESRAYSFASLTRDGVADFLVRNIPDGRMSSYLRDRARPGDALTIRGPMGSFYLRPLVRPALMLAGGTGLAPFLAMLETLARDGAAFPVHLVYGVTNDADLVAVDRLAALAGRLPTFTFDTVVASPDSDHPKKGYVTDHLDPQHLNGGDVDIYLCGPPPMVDAVRRFLSGRNITPATFHFEKFSATVEAGA